MPDEADEIALKLWEQTWDWERREGIAEIAEALREFARKAVDADRKQTAAILKNFSPLAVADQIRRIREGK